MAAAQLLPAPPWEAARTPEPVALDEGGQIDVTAYVRFETGFDDIDYGVLDIQVYFRHGKQRVNVYPLHYFALTQEYPKTGRAVEGWAENFAFPPALLKLIVRYEGRTINVFVQHCIAINDKGISIYGPNKGYRRRLIHHVLYHERPLLEEFDSKVPSLPRDP